MKNKAKVYIDGANIFYTQKKLGWVFDWKKIKKLVEKDKEIIEWKYYVGIKEDDEKIKKYLKYLDYTGFNVITKPLKKIRSIQRFIKPITFLKQILMSKSPSIFY